jgi:hypothetical protein
MFSSSFARILLTAAVLAVISPSARAGGQFSIGIEGFGDRYREPTPAADVTDTSAYGSITAGYLYTGQQHWFTSVDGRASYGRDSYKSPSGTSSGAPQYEGELRFRLGAVLHELGGVFSPYTGIGWRTFLDNGAGTQTNLGYYGYDRYINQIYVPLGVALSYHTDDDWTLTPVLEFDALLYGHVESKVSQFIGTDINNDQNDGYALRGEFMIGHRFGEHEFQFGPFVRYWNVEDSDFQADPTHPGYGFYEPHNTRLQAGAALRMKL